MFKNYTSMVVGRDAQHRKENTTAKWLLSMVLLFGILIPGLKLSAQSTVNYTFATNTNGSLALDINSNAIDMSTGTTQLLGTAQDEVVSSVANLPFEFYLMGNRYTQFSVSSNGLVALSATSTTTSGSTYSPSGGTTTTPLISAFAADLETSNTGKIHYKTVGTAPNRTLVIEFLNMSVYYDNVASADATYQVRLYENTGVVDFVYGTVNVSKISASLVGSIKPAIGFATNTTANNNIYVTISSNTATKNGTFTANPNSTVGPITNLTSASDGSRRYYRFTPPVPANPTAGITFTATGPTITTLNFTDSSTTETGFSVYISTDNITFSNIGVVASSTTAATGGAKTINITGLVPSTLYYFKVVANSEGALSGPVTGNVTTAAPITYTWNQTGSASFATAANWTPTRTTPDATDILVINGSSTPTPTLTNVPTQTIAQFKLLNNANATLTSAAAATLTIGGAAGTDLDIPSGSTLNLSGSSTLGLAFGTGSQTASIAGTLTYSSTAGTAVLNLTNCVATVTGTINLSTTTNAVTLTGVSATSLLMNAGSTMNLTTIQTIIPLATWAATSNINFTGSGTSFTNAGQTFGNFTYNSASPTATVSFFTSSTATIQGNLNIQQTGTGSGRFRALTSGSLTVNGDVNITNTTNLTAVDLMNGAAVMAVTGNINISNGSTVNFANGAGTLTVGGSVTIANTAAVNFANAGGATTQTITGNLNLNSSGTNVLSNTSGTGIVLNVGGNLTQTAGTFTLGTSAASGTLKVAGTFNQSGGTMNSTSSATSTLEFNGTSAQNVTLTSAVTGPISVRVNNASGINLTGALAINAGSSLIVSNGNVTGSGSIVYNAVSGTLLYNGTTGAQTASALEFPAASGPASLTINNTATSPNNTVTLPFSRSVGAGTFTLTAGILVTSPSSVLTLTNSAVAALSGGSTTSYVRGAFARTILASLAGASTYNFPVGKTSYNLIQILPTTGAGTSVVQFESFDGATGGSPDLSTLVSLNNDKYWSGSVTSGAGNFTSTTVKLTDASYVAQSRMAQSATLTGTYGAISGAPVSNVLTSSSVTSLNFITVGQFGTLISGTKTVCPSGCDYASLTLAGGAFESLNSAIVNGNVNLEIAGNLTSETGLNALNAITSPYTLKIYPTGSARTISGAAASAALIKLNGADRITIDGSIGGTGTDRSLSITNTGTTTPTAISLISLGTGAGAINNIIKNCNISTGTSTGIGYGVAVGGSTPGASGADNDNITIQNNAITVANIGVYAVGTASTSTGGNDSLSILDNTISSNTTIADMGIQVGNGLAGNISRNTISVENSSTTVPVAISIETGFVSSSVTRNNITKALATNTGGYGGRGITVGTGTATSALTIANNFISGVNGTNWSSFSNASSMGIALGMVGASSTVSTTAGGINLYYNSVNMTGTYSSTTACLTAALYVGSGVTALDTRNNIFVNSLNNSGTGTTSKAYSIYSAAANTAFAPINYNDYYVSGTQGVLGFLTSDRTNLAGMVSGFGGNANSLNIVPNFTSSSDLHLVTTTNASLDASGTTIAGITNDYDNDTRNASTPDIGADEFTQPNCTGAVAGTATGSNTFCTSGTPTITASGYSVGVTTSYQWMSSTTAGDYPNAGSAVSGQTNPATLSTGVVSTTTYYWLRVTCGATSATDNSNMITVTINQAPGAVTVNGAGTFCSSTTINATGGLGGIIYFQGITTNGTSTATLSSSQSITSTGTYYFRALANGCWGTEGSAAVVINQPAGITGTDANICAGGTGSMQASATNCSGFVNSGTTISGTWTAATDPTALRITSSITNTSTCSFDSTITRNYVAQQFQVSATGNYVFEMNDNSAYDGMGYIVTGAFTPGSCTNGTWVRGDDDDGVAGNEPRLGASGSGSGLMQLTAGVTYTLISTTYSLTSGTVSGSFVWTVTPPSGAQVMLPGTGVIQWYTAASGGTAIGTGSPFNPVGVANSGLANTNTAGTTTYYAACSLSSACRTPVNFVIAPNYTITASAGLNGSVTPSGATTVCSGGSQSYTIAANSGYHIVDVLVDSASIGVQTSYSFTNVTANHTISATFAPDCTVPSLSTSQTNISCLNATGSATVNTTGGSSPFTYLWNDPSAQITATASGLAAGTYSVTVTATGGCSTSTSVTITSNTTAPSAPSITPSSGTLTCTTTSISATASSTGQGTISYSWNGGATPLTATNSFSSAGTYTVTATDSANGCIATNGITIGSDTTPPTVNASATPSSICAGNSSSLSATGTANTYVWNPGSLSGANQTVSPGSTTVYTVIGTNTSNGCTAQAQATVTVTAQPQWFLDADGDHYYTGTAISSCTSPGTGYTTTGILGGGDCNDTDAVINPGAAEICYNNVDDNCSGTSSEGCAPIVVNMTPSYNNTTLVSLATAVPAVGYTYAPYTNLKYRFKITNITAVPALAPIEVIQTSRYVTIPASLHSYNAQYTITVSAVINDEVVPYAGNTITVNSPAVQLITLNSATCGATLATLASTLTANPGLNATGYTFRIRLNDSNPTPTYYTSQSATRFVSANSFTGFPLQYSTSYKVSVQYTFNDPVTNLPVQSGYGSECVVNTPSIPLTGLASPTCGSQVATMNANISASAASYATAYQFRIRLFGDNGPTPTYYYSVPNASRFSSLTAFQGITFAYNTAYSISVQYSVLNGSTTVWSGYGPECKVTTPFFPVTSLVASQCGLATPTSLTQQLNITPYPGFPNYKVKLDEVSGEDIVNSEEIIVTYSYFRLNQFSIAQPGKNYNVSVAIKLNGVFGDYDTACDLFTAPLGKTISTVPFKATAYPNPFANNFMLDVKTNSQSSVNLKVYDMVGRLIEQRNVSVSDMGTTTIGDQYPTGVYNVVVSQEDSVQTVRVVKR